MQDGCSLKKFCPLTPSTGQVLCSYFTDKKTELQTGLVANLQNIWLEKPVKNSWFEILPLGALRGDRKRWRVGEQKKQKSKTKEKRQIRKEKRLTDKHIQKRWTIDVYPLTGRDGKRERVWGREGGRRKREERRVLKTKETSIKWKGNPLDRRTFLLMIHLIRG